MKTEDAPPDSGDGPDRSDSLDRPDGMRETVIDIVIEALQQQGLPDVSRTSVLEDRAHREAFIDMLGDCRPLPVVRQLMADVHAGRL